MKKYLYLLLLSAAFLGCSKEETSRIKFGEITLTRADLDNSIWQTPAKAPVYIFNASGDILDSYFILDSYIGTSTTHYYKFENGDVAAHYCHYKFFDAILSVDHVLDDGTVIPAGSSAPWIKTDYFFKITDESLYFDFDASRDLQTNISPIGTLKNGESLFLYELTPQRFTIRKPRKDLDPNLPKSQYVMQQYRFEATTDEKLLEQLRNAPDGDKYSYEKVKREYDMAYYAWLDSFRKK